MPSAYGTARPLLNFCISSMHWGGVGQGAFSSGDMASFLAIGVGREEKGLERCSTCACHPSPTQAPSNLHGPSLPSTCPPQPTPQLCTQSLIRAAPTLLFRIRIL
eukprot:182705-Chlamydomonas_euryale.AAC.6